MVPGESCGKKSPRWRTRSNDENEYRTEDMGAARPLFRMYTVDGAKP